MAERFARIRRRGFAVLLAACIVQPAIAASASAVAKDPLALAARKSDKASRSLLLAATVAGKRMVAVGERGIVIYSDNQGKTWNQSDVPVSVTLTSVYFATPSKGWVAGHDGVILHSVDGGQTWKKQFDGNQANVMVLAEAERRLRDADSASEQVKKVAAAALDDAKAAGEFGPSRPLFGIWFSNDLEGYVVGAFGQFFHTNDGGEHWESWATRLDTPDGLHYNAISSTPGGLLTISGEAGKVYRSRDGGKTWQALDTGYRGQIYGVLGTPNGLGGEALVAFGFAGHMFRSADGGVSWQALDKQTAKSLTCGIALPNGSLVLVSQDGRLLQSDDQGRNFTMTRTGTDMSVVAIVPVMSEKKAALFGSGGARFVSLNDPDKVGHQ
ncbi:MAG: photosystem I reaction center subunit IV [Burkholderiales bacterium]|nr:photosystem I reaction center subunit IV [Burkholderiales bacterium]